MSKDTKKTITDLSTEIQNQANDIQHLRNTLATQATEINRINQVLTRRDGQVNTLKANLKNAKKDLIDPDFKNVLMKLLAS